MNYNYALELFYRRCVANNLSNRTIEFYRYCLIPLGKFLYEHNVIDIDKVQGKDIEDYIASLTRKVSATTVSDNYVAIRAFFRFLYNSEYLNVYPMRNL